MYVNVDEPDRVPPGPWKWKRTTHGGLALVTGDGTVLLDVEDGHGSPDLYNVAVQRLLAEAWETRTWGELVRELDIVTAKLDEAREWARRILTNYLPDPYWEMVDLPEWLADIDVNRRAWADESDELGG